MVTKKHVVVASVAGFAAAYILIALELKMAIRGLLGQGQKRTMPFAVPSSRRRDLACFSEPIRTSRP